MQESITKEHQNAKSHGICRFLYFDNQVEKCKTSPI